MLSIFRGSVVVILCIYVSLLKAEPPADSKAARYYKLLQVRPESGPYMDRFVESWDEIAYGSQEDFLKQRIMAKGKDRDSARLLLAIYLEHDGREKEALNAWNNIPDKYAERPVILLFRARLEFGNAKYKEAEKLLSKCLKKGGLSEDKKFAALELLFRTRLRLNDEKGYRETIAEMDKLAGNDFVLQEAVIDLMIDEALYNDAIDKCRKLLAVSPAGYRKGMLNLKLAGLYVYKGDSKSALQEYEKVLEQSGSGSWLEKEAVSRIREIYNASGDKAGLLAFYKKAVGGKRSRPELCSIYIKALYDVGKHDEAFKQFAALLKRMPSDDNLKIAYADMLRKGKRYAEAVKVYDTVLRTQSKNGEVLLVKAAAQAGAGQREAAVKTIEQFLDLARNQEFVWSQVTSALRAMKLNKAAGKYYDLYVAKFPKSLDALIERGRFLASHGSKDAAVSSLMKAGKKADKDQLLRIVRELSGIDAEKSAFELMRQRAGDFKKSWSFNMDYVRHALQGQDQNAAVGAALAAVMASNTPERLDRALASASYVLGKYKLKEKTALDLYRKTALTPVEYCLLADIEGKKDASEKVLSTGMKKYPKSILLTARYAGFARERRKYDQALNAYRRLLKSDLQHRKRWHQEIMRTALKAGKDELVVKNALAWLQENPNLPEVYLSAAAAMKQCGKNDEAAKILKRAYAAFPDNLQVSLSLAEIMDRTGKRDIAFRLRRRRVDREKTLTGKLAAFDALVNKSGYDMLPRIKAIYTKRQQDSPKAVFPVLALASIAFKEHDRNRYRELLTKASSLKKDDPNILCRIALVDEQNGYHHRAEQLLLEAVKLDKSRRSTGKLADFYFRNGETEKALRLSLDLDGKSASPEKLMQAAYSLLLADEPYRAQAFIGEALKKNPADPKINYVMGLALKDVGKDEAAARHFLHALDSIDALPEKTSGNQSFPVYGWRMVKDVPNAIKEILLQSTMSSILNNPYYRRGMIGFGGLHSGMSRGIGVPGSKAEMKVVIMAQLAKLNSGLGPTKSSWLLNELKCRSISFPELRLGLPMIMRGDSGVWRRFAQLNPGSEETALLYSYLGGRGIDADAKTMTGYFEVLKKNYPKEAINIVVNGWRRNEKTSPEMLKEAIAMLKDKKVPASIAYSLFTMGEMRKLIGDEDKKKILSILVEKISTEDKTNIYFGTMLVVPLLRYGNEKDAIKLMQVSHDKYKQTYHSPAPKMEMLLRQSPMQQYVVDQLLNSAASGIHWANGMKYSLARLKKDSPGEYEKVRMKMKELFKDKLSGLDQMIILSSLNSREENVKSAEKIIEDKKKSPEERYVAAVILAQNGSAIGLLDLAANASKLYKDPNRGQLLFTMIICAALTKPDVQKNAEAAEKAAMELSKEKLSKRELGMLASAMHKLKRKKAADALDKQLMDKIKKDNLAAKTTRVGNPRKPAYNKRRQMRTLFDAGKYKQGLEIAKSEYYSRFMRSLQQSRQYGHFNFSYAGSIVTYVKSKNKGKEFLEMLRPKEAESPVNALLMYAYACESAKDTKEAYKYYMAAFKHAPDKKEAINMALAFCINNDDTNIKDIIGKIPQHRLNVVLAGMGMNHYRYSKKFGRMLECIEAIVERQKKTPEKDLIKFDNSSFVMICSALINKAFPELSNNYYHSRNRKNKKVKNAKELKERSRKLIDFFANHAIKTRPGLIASAFEYKFYMADGNDNEQKKLFELGLGLIKSYKVSSFSISHFMGGYVVSVSGQGNSFWEFMISYAATHGRLKELQKFIKDQGTSAEVLAAGKLYSCKPAAFPAEMRKYLESHKDRNFEMAIRLAIDAAEYVLKKVPRQLNQIIIDNISFGPVFRNQNLPQKYVDILVRNKKIDVALDFINLLAKKINSSELKTGYANQAKYQYSAAVNRLLSSHPENAVKLVRMQALLSDKSSQQFNVLQQIRNSMNNLAHVERKPRWELFGKSPEEFDFCILPDGSSLFAAYTTNLRNYRKKFKDYSGNDFGGKILSVFIKTKYSNEIFSGLVDIEKMLGKLPEKERSTLYRNLGGVVAELRLPAGASLSGRAEQLRIQAMRTAGDNAVKEAEKFISSTRGNDVPKYYYRQHAVKLAIKLSAGHEELLDKLIDHTIKELKISRNMNTSSSTPLYDVTRFIEDMARRGENSLPMLAATWRTILKYPENTNKSTLDKVWRGLRNIVMRAKKQQGGQGLVRLFNELPEVFKDDPPFLFPIVEPELRGISIARLKQLKTLVASKKYPVNKTGQECALIVKYLSDKKSHVAVLDTLCKVYQKRLMEDNLPEETKQNIILHLIRQKTLLQLTPLAVDMLLKDIIRTGKPYDDHRYAILFEAMNKCKIDDKWPKAAKELINSFNVTSDMSIDKRKRRLYVLILSIALNLKDKTEINHLLKESGNFSKPVPDVISLLLNYGFVNNAGDIVKKFTDMPLVSSDYSIKLNDIGWKNGIRLFKNLKESDAKMCAGAYLLLLRHYGRKPSAEVTAFVADFDAIYLRHKFKSVDRRNEFLLIALRAKIKMPPRIERDIEAMSRKLTVREIVKLNDSNFMNYLADQMADSVVNGNCDRLNRRLTEIRKLHEHDSMGRKPQQVLQSLLRSIVDNLSRTMSKYRGKVTEVQIAAFAELLSLYLEMYPDRVYSSRRFALMLLLNHLSGNDSASLKVIKACPANRIKRINPSYIARYIKGYLWMSNIYHKKQSQTLETLFASKPWQEIRRGKEKAFVKEQEKMLKAAINQ